jgi:hypothetical protein
MKSKIMKRIKSPIKSRSKTYRSLRRYSGAANTGGSASSPSLSPAYAPPPKGGPYRTIGVEFGRRVRELCIRGTQIRLVEHQRGESSLPEMRAPRLVTGTAGLLLLGAGCWRRLQLAGRKSGKKCEGLHSERRV